MRNAPAGEFDYSALPTDDANFLRNAAQRVRNKVLLGAVHVGNELIEAKKRLDHGRFEDWVEAEFTFSVRTARNYMAVACIYSKSEILAVLGVTALALLASPSTPAEVIDAVEGMLGAGERPSPADVRRLIHEARYGVAPDPKPEPEPEPQPDDADHPAPEPEPAPDDADPAPESEPAPDDEDPAPEPEPAPDDEDPAPEPPQFPTKALAAWREVIAALQLNVEKSGAIRRVIARIRRDLGEIEDRLPPIGADGAVISSVPPPPAPGFGLNGRPS